MAYFYFFKDDKQCAWMQKEFMEEIPKYLHEPVDYHGIKVKFYLILNWIGNATGGASRRVLDEMGLNYVDSVAKLPQGAGIYVTAYDANVEELKAAQNNGIPIIEHPCPWIRQLRSQILAVNPKTHQCILMIDDHHMVYECFKSIIPEDAIVIQPENYKEKIAKYKNEKPVTFIVYATFRKKDAEGVVNFIQEHYRHPDNILNGYQKTLCIWTKQGLFEEINKEIQERYLKDVWVICSSEKDRSTKSILQHIQEAGGNPLIIKELADVPGKVQAEDRIGVLFAPIPVAAKVKKIKDSIQNNMGKKGSSFADCL